VNTELTSAVEQLIETIDNGQLGLSEAAARLSERGHAEMASTFLQLSEERSAFSSQLRAFLGATGDMADHDGTTPGLLHRGLIAITDKVTGDSPTALLKNVVAGEAHAISEYEGVLESDMPPALRGTIALQLVAVKASHKLAEALLAQSQVKRRP
jgi:uncharacterized protein (TIGR02284 family)